VLGFILGLNGATMATLEPESSTMLLRYQMVLSLVQHPHPNDPRIPIVRIAASNAQR
jgi:hypothetical protein